MRNALLLAMLATAAAPADAAERRYSVTDFDRVRIEGPYDVRIVTGGPSSALASGDTAGLDGVSVEVQGRTLRIRPSTNAWGGYPGTKPGPVQIDIGARDLREVTVIGPASVAIDRMKGLRVDLSLSGSGSLAVDAVDADTLSLGLLGSGRMAVAGKAKQLRSTIQGSADLDARALGAVDVELTADTSGSVTARATRAAKVRAFGRGQVEVVGATACTVTGPAASFVTCGR